MHIAVNLFFDGCDDAGMTMAKRIHGKTAEEIGAAFAVFCVYVDAFSPFYFDRQAMICMKKIFFIF